MEIKKTIPIVVVISGVSAILMLWNPMKTTKSLKYYEQGQVLLEQGDYVKAQTRFETSIALNKDFVPAKIGMAKCLYALHDYDKVVSYLEDIQNQHPNQYPSVHYYLAESYFILHRKEDANVQWKIVASIAESPWSTLARKKLAANATSQN